PTRCVEFGDNFDFIFLFKGKGIDKKLDDDELVEFIKVIKENIKVSEELERFLVDKDKRCWYVTKDIKFGDNESTTDKKEL
ncbi:MAG: hypothetical protein K2G03_07415, partial [Bacilli bacterium]|nr:hypothetical protein [Bacilli bacterium]